ncbi:MAG: tRNA (adenosine(37)-N6)-threonylcarbamoyltransferase complex dimerization subunit type 1 TsaB [Candidatus Omnitrophota bacterium]|nr:MAG: tRNA (adenosine(37)-N6)-threonylcarbamoyltransferase complex dimerization subunit type 1 TsaB [Candidatus Omnitrophota bacterium]
MNLLAFDTSSYNLSFALLSKDRIVVNFNRRIKFGASSLIPIIEKHIKNSPMSMDLKKIDAFVVGEGPGSFTGLRIAFSVAKAFSLSLGKPVIKIGSFFSIAYPFKDKYDKIAVISDARRNLIYATSFRCRKGQIKKEAKERLVSLAEYIKAHRDYFFITYDKHIREAAFSLNPKLNFFSRDVYPQANYLLELAKISYEKKEFIPLDKLKPLYLHPKTCQIRRKVAV